MFHSLAVFFAEVASKRRVLLDHYVEKERSAVVPDVLVVQEQFGNEAQVLAVDALLLAVDLEDGNSVIPVYLVSRRAKRLRLLASYLLFNMILKLAFFLENKHTVLANKKSL